jgi:hypothetical protein
MFNNRVAGSVIAPIYGPDPANPYLGLTGNPTNGFPAGTQAYGGSGLSGSNYFAQLFTAPGLNQPISLLQPQSPITTFRTGAAVGFFAPQFLTANNLDPESFGGATVQIRVWDNSSGTLGDWAKASNAWKAGNIAAGMSLPVNITVQIGGNSTPPPPMYGLESFNIYFIPEPSLPLLFLSGVGMFLARSRKPNRGRAISRANVSNPRG